MRAYDAEHAPPPEPELDIAGTVFAGMPTTNVVSWNTLIIRFSDEGLGGESVGHYCEMRKEGVMPDATSVSAVLTGCSVYLDVEFAKQVHAEAIKIEELFNLYVGNSLFSTYTKCGEFDLAVRVFVGTPGNNHASWTGLISKFVDEGYESETAEFYCATRKEDVRPNKKSLSAMLKCCSTCLDLDFAKQVHAEAIKAGLSSDLSLGNSLIGVFANCNHLGLACKVFAGMPVRDIVSWTALISGFVGEGYEREATEFYCDMRKEVVRPDEKCLSIVLKCCWMCLDLEFAKQVHAEAIKHGVASLLNALVGISPMTSESSAGWPRDVKRGEGIASYVNLARL